MQLPSHTFCENCDAIQLVALNPLEQLDISGHYRGGDMVCDFCGAIVCTMYEPVEAAR